MNSKDFMPNPDKPKRQDNGTWDLGDHTCSLCNGTENLYEVFRSGKWLTEDGEERTDIGICGGHLDELSMMLITEVMAG